MPQNLPDRQPVEDTLSAVLVQLGEAVLLTQTAPPDVPILAEGDFIIRYAVPLLGKPHLAIVPDLIVMDYGDLLNGQAAWNFLLHRSHLHPRAEVFGFRNDGVDDMLTVKWLDLAQAVQVYAYAHAAAQLPIARLSALIAPPDAALPAQVLEYLTRYDSLDQWQANADE